MVRFERRVGSVGLLLPLRNLALVLLGLFALLKGFFVLLALLNAVLGLLGLFSVVGGFRGSESGRLN